MTTPFYQIGWSDSHGRDIRLETTGSLSAPMVRLIRYYSNGEPTYINLLMGEAMRLYNALGQMIYNQQQCQKQYAEPDKSNWHDYGDQDDPLGSD